MAARLTQDRRVWRRGRCARFEKRASQWRFGLEGLEPRQVLTADLTVAQTAALLRGVEVFTEQVSAMQLSGALAEQAVGIAQPIGTILSVGDELRRDVAEPLAAYLRSVQGAITPAMVQAAIAELAPTGSVAIREPGDGTLWFDVDLAGSRQLVDFTLDVGQRPSAIPGQQTLYDRGLRLEPLEVDVTAGYAGRVSFGIDLAADLTAEQAVRIDVGTLRVFARATHSGAAALADLDASFGSVRLGPADVDVDFDVAAAIDLAGGPKRLGEILGVPARESFTVIPAIDSRFQVSIPFTLGIGGFAETGTELRVGIGATGFFHEATDVAPLTLTLLKDTDPGAAVNWQPGSLSPGEGGAFTAPGEFGLAPFGGVSANDLGAFLVELERVAPTLFERLDVPLVGKSVGEIAEIGGRVSDFVASLRTPEGDFRFETADDLLDELAEFFGAAGQPRDRSTFDMKWSMATQGLQFRVPLEFQTPDAGLPLVFDAGSLRSALPAVVPIDVTGRGTATVHVDATTLALVGGVTKRGAAGLPDRRVTLDTSFADALRDLDLPDLLPGGAEFSFGLRNGTRVDVNLDGVLPAWRQNGATMRDVRDFLNGVAPASLAVDLVDGRLRFTDKTSGPNLFKVVLGEEQTITPSKVTGGDPLTTTRLSLAALAFGLAAAPTAGDTLEGVSLELSALRDRLYFKPQAEGTVAIKLDVDVRAAVSLGTLTVGTHPLAPGAAAIRSTVAVVPSLGTAVAAGDGRITLEELETAGVAAVSLSVTPSSHAGVLQLDAPAALVGELGIDIAAYQSAPLDNLAAVRSRTVPYLYLADSAAGSTWSFDVQPSEKLVELATGIGNVSLADLDRIFEAFLDKLGKIDFWNLKLPGIDRSFGELFPFANALECLDGFDVKTLGVPDIDAATGTVTWPAGSFGALATDFLAKSMAAQQTFSQGNAAVQAAGMRLQSLAWELQALLVEIQNHPPGDPAADLGLLQRVRNLTRAATAEMAGLPENFNDLRTSLEAIPTVLDGLKFSLDSFAGRLADAIARGLGDGHDPGTGGGTGGEPNVPKVKVTPRKGGSGGDDTGGGIAGPTGQILFDIEIGFAGVKRSFDFSALDITVGGATLPFEITGTGQLQYAFGGTFATQIGWDFKTHSPILVAAATHADLTASIESVNQTGFRLTASLGGLANISIGTDQTPATIRLTAAPNSPAGTPATFSLAADSHAYFEAVLPLFAASVVADGPLGTARLEATFAKPAAGSATFDVSADFVPDDINLDALFKNVAFAPDLWKELICGFMTDVTNDFLAKKLAQLPLVGGIDFSKVTFFEDVCAFIERLDFGSPGKLNQSVPQETKEYVKDPGGGYVVKTPGSNTPTVLIADPPGGNRGITIETPEGGTKTGASLPENWGKLGLRDRVILPITMRGSRQIKIGKGELDVGLDGLGITIGGTATLDLDFVLDIGLGFSRLEGFFIQTLGTAANKADEVTVSASLKLDDAAIGIGLGPVKLTATDTREEPELVATLAADLDSGTAGGIGRSLSLTQIPAALVAADFKGSLKAGLDLELKADLFSTVANGLPGLPGLPGLAATLHTGFAKVTAGAAAGNGSPTYDPVEFTKLSDFSARLADSLYFEITDVGVDLGSLLRGPIAGMLEKINDLLKPVRPMVDLLLAEVPVVSDVSKKAGLGAVTFLTLVKAYDADAGAKAEKFLQTVRDVTTVADTLARTARTGRLSLGTLAVLDAAKAQLLGKTPVTAGAFQPDKAAASGQDSVGALAELEQLDDGKIAFPIFDNPLASAFGLLFGKDVDLVTWDVPDLTNVGFGFEQSFPIFPPLFARIFGSVEFNTNIDVGYDTRGIRLALAGEEVDPEKLAYGVYLADIHGGRDTPEVSLTATIGAAAELNVVVAKAGAAGGLRGTIGANLRDPNGDGKVHLDEFMRLFNKSPECIFDFEGSLDAFFAAYLKLGFSTPFGFVTLFSAGVDLLDIRLLDWAAKTCPIEPPKLAAVVEFFDVQISDPELGPPNFGRVELLQQQGTEKVLALNLGARAGVDGFADDSEEFEVVRAIDPATKLPKRDTAGNYFVVVRGRGIESREFNEKDFDFIWFDGRAGNDVITIDPAITKPVVGHGGDGNDRITGGSGRNFLFGDWGRDRLLGRGGIDELHGGGDGDLLVGYGGDDVLFGDEGTDQLLGDDEIGDIQEFNTKHPEFVAGQPGADTIDGGLDSDTIFGGDGNDRLLGEESTDGFGGDTIRGGNGDDTIIGQQGNDQLYGDAGNDVIWGDSEGGTYDSQLGVGNSDLIEGGSGANFLWGGADRDFLYAFSQEIGIEAPGDTLRDFAAVLTAQSFTPESGLPVYSSSAGTWSRSLLGSTTAYAFASWLEGGAGDDVLVGTQGADRIGGGFEADEIKGGTGADLLAGGPGSDWIVSLGGNSRIFGGHGDDVIEGGPGDNWIEGGPGDDEIYAGLGRDVVWGGTTAAGYDAFILPFEEVTGSVANVEPGRLIQAALHGGFRTRPTQDPQASACEPDVFFHPEVYPDAPFTITVRIFEDRDGDGTEADPSGTVDADAVLRTGDYPWWVSIERLTDDPYQRVVVPDVSSTGGTVRLPGDDGLPAGTYRVSVTGDADFWRRNDGPTFTADVTLDAEHPHVILPAGFFRPGRIGGIVRQEQPQGELTPLANASVYIDANDSGTFDVGEKTDRTNAQGRYSFDYLFPGDYSVRLAVDPGRWNVFPAVRDVGLESSEVVDDRDFTIAERLTGTIRGTVLGEPKGQPREPLSGLTVFLDVIANGVLDRGEPSTITGADGGYRIDDLPAASYTVRLDASPLLDVRVTAPTTWTVNLFDGQDAAARDFLVEFQGDTIQRQLLALASFGDFAAVGPTVSQPPLGPPGGGIVQLDLGTIQGSVWLHDPAAQDTLTPDLVKVRSEPGIADQTISLYREENGVETLVATTTSSRQDASFQFPNLTSGTYIVRQTPTRKFFQVTGGGVSKPESLFAMTYRAAGGTDAGKSTLWEVATGPFVASEIASFTEFVARDLAMFDRSTAYIAGAATAGGASGLWRYDVSSGGLTNLGPCDFGTLVALDVLDAARLIGVTDGGTLVTYTPDINLWQQLGRLQTTVGNLPQPLYAVGDLAVRSPQEVYFVGYVGSPPDLSLFGFPNPARQQAVFQVDTTLVSARLTLTAIRQADVQQPEPAKDEYLEYLTGLERTVSGGVFALGSLGGVFAADSFGGGAAVAFEPTGRIFAAPEYVRSDHVVYGGLAVTPYAVVPDTTRTDFRITITGRQVVSVGFGNAERVTRLYDGDDLIDGGCDASADLLIGDDARNVTFDLVQTHLSEIGSFIIDDDIIIYGGRDTIRGRGGDDRIDGGLQGDVLSGGAGNDMIQGGRGGARADGTVGAGNWLDGGDGDDSIAGGGQADAAYGGAGKDTILGMGGDDELFGQADADALDGGDGDDLLVVGAGGGSQGQTAIGGFGDDTIVVRDVTLGGEFAVAPTGQSADTYRGDGGMDTLVLDTSPLAAADDLLFVSLSNAQLNAYGVDTALGIEVGIFAGGAGDNVFSAGVFTGRVVMRGNGGKDTLTGGDGDDLLDAGIGVDNQLAGGRGDDRFLVGVGSTTRINEFPNAGTDTLDLATLGSAGFDVRVGNAVEGATATSTNPGVTVRFFNDGVDHVLLGNGSNSLTLRNGMTTTARFVAGGGTDSIRYTDTVGDWGAWAAGVAVDLAAGTATGTAGIEGFDNATGGEGNDELSGTDPDELSGTDGENRLDGRGGSDTLTGRGGDDTLLGGAGDDFLFGNAGDDTLRGEAGTNVLAGNADDDTYLFLDQGETDTVAEIINQGSDQMLFLPAAGGILFEVGGQIVATFGMSRVTALSSAGIDLVRGGIAADTFRIADGAAFAGRLEGGGTSGSGFPDLDTLDYSLWTSPVTVDYSPIASLAAPRAVTGVAGVVDLRHVIGGSKSDSLTGGVHAVWFEGRNGGDTLTGSSAADKLEGDADADTIRGDAGNDLLRGGTGNDTLEGGADNDTFGFTNDFGTDSVLEGAGGGSDVMDFSGVNVPLTVTLGSVTATTADGDRATHAGTAIERVVGGSADDLFKMTGPDVVFPGTLDGGGGVNTLRYENPTRAIAAEVAASRTPNVGGALRFATITADSNLFAPAFVGGGNTGSVNENAAASTIVYTARATDADDAPGNTITYSLKTGQADDAALVTVDPVKGEVRLKTPANFEAKNAYRFTIVATDAGIPAKSVETAVTINVLNVVEPRSAPRITAPTGFFFTEDTPGGLRFVNESFSDADSAGATVMTVTLGIADGVIAAANGGGVVVGGTPTSRTFTGRLANLNAFFMAEPARITYTPAANASGVRTLVVTIAEGPVTQRLSSTVRVPVTIHAVNDAPELRIPIAFTVTEDVAGNLVWPAGVPVVRDVDSASVTVRLTVDAGVLSAAPAPGVAVSGTPLSRAFTGTSAAVSAYFATIGRIRYTAPLNDTANRTLLCEAGDGVANVSANRTIRVTPVNDPPTIAAVVAFGGGVRNTPFVITHDMLRTSSGAVDVDSPAISFRVEAIRGGTLQRWDGADWKNVSVAAAAAPAQRWLLAGQNVRWIPPVGAVGVRPAFTVRAWDGRAFSTVTAVVTVQFP